jgi:hypothetical protein
MVGPTDPTWQPLGVRHGRLEPSRVVFVAVKFGFISRFDPPLQFSRITLLKI